MTTHTLSGARVRELRESLKLKRPAMAAAVDLTVAQLGRIEVTSHFSEEEGSRIEEFFMQRGALPRYKLGPNGGLSLEDGTPLPVIVETDDNSIIDVQEWNGFKRGDMVRLRGEEDSRKVYEFRRYFKSPTQEYVEVYGPGAKSKLRPVRPERVYKRRK